MKSRGKGLLFAGLGASLWGSAGVTGQVLMDTYHLPATALSVWRLILSGFLLLGFDYLLHRESLLRPWKDRADALRLFVFAVFGMWDFRQRLPAGLRRERLCCFSGFHRQRGHFVCCRFI